MTLKEANHYLNTACLEGYLNVKEWERISALPRFELIKAVEEMVERGDFELNNPDSRTFERK